MACLPNMVVMAPSDEVYALYPHTIGSRSGYMLSTLTRLVPAPGICSLPSPDWLPLRFQADLIHMVATANAIDDCPSSVRYPRGNGLGVDLKEAGIGADLKGTPLEIGKGRVMREGTDICLLGFGTGSQYCAVSNPLLASLLVRGTLVRCARSSLLGILGVRNVGNTAHRTRVLRLTRLTTLDRYFPPASPPPPPPFQACSCPFVASDCGGHFGGARREGDGGGRTLLQAAGHAAD
eukprot:2047677-Pyramimonas_sp.AAC.1